MTLDTAEPHISERQYARETDGTGLSGETNEQDFQAFYQENVTLIYRFVLSHVGNREEAEDLTSQVFLKAVRGMNAERSRKPGINGSTRSRARRLLTTGGSTPVC